MLLLSLALLVCRSAAQDGREPRALEEGRPLQAELGGGQSHSYRVESGAGQFLRATVEQRGIDIVLRVFGPDGQRLSEVDNLNARYGVEAVSLITERPGRYRLEVGAVNHEAVAGRYELRLEPLHAVTDTDRVRLAADQGFTAALQLVRQAKTPESRREASDRLEANLSLWRQLGDKDREAFTLSAIAGVRRAEGRPDEALKLFNQALSLYRALGDQYDKAATLYSLGVLHHERGESDRALTFLNEALPLWHTHGERQAEADTHNYLGFVHFNRREFPQALEHHNQALRLFRELKNREGEAKTLSYVGGIYSFQGEPQKAAENYDKSLAYWRSVNDLAWQAATLHGIAAAYDYADEDQKAIEPYTQAAELYRRLKEPRGQAAVLYDLGTTYDELGDKQKALELLNQALTLRRELDDKARIATTLYYIGTVHDDLNDTRKALEFFNEALPLHRAAGDRRGEAQTLNYMGDVYLLDGENEQALKYYQDALAIWRETKDVRREAEALNNIGLLYLSTNEAQKALDALMQAQTAAHTAGDPKNEAQAFNGLGLFYNSVGNFQQALKYQELALSLWRKAGDKEGEAQTLSHISSIYSVLNETGKAAETLGRVSPLTEGLDEAGIEALKSFNQGVIYFARDEYQKAIDAFNHTLAAARAIKRDKIVSYVTVLIGICYYLLDENQKALEQFRSALPDLREVGNRNFEAVALAGIAIVERDLGHFAEAKTQIEAALRIVESLRNDVVGQEFRISFFASMQSYFDLYIDILMELHKRQPAAGHDGEAFRVSERGRARSLLEILNEAKADIRQGVDPVLLKRDWDLRRQLNVRAQQQQMRMFGGADTEKQMQAAANEIQSLTTELEQVEAEIRQKSPAYAALTQPQPLTLKEIQEQVLDADTLLLEYALGNDRSFLWAVNTTGIVSYELPEREEIDAAARKVYELLNARTQEVGGETSAQRQQRIARADAEYPAAAARLSEMVLAPAARQLGNRRLLIVAHGPLQYVPFGALPDPTAGSTPSAPLILKHEIVSGLSASTLALLRRETEGRPAAPKGVAVLADPVFSADDERLRRSPRGAPRRRPARRAQTARNVEHDRPADTGGAPRIKRLPYTRQEAEEILKVAAPEESIRALDFAANRRFVTGPQLSRYRYLHFATHGFVNSEHPELSGIVLSMVDEKGAPQDGFLRAHEIYNLKLNAELVVLSACQTGLGKEVTGEGVLGLTRGFMYAGAPRVVVSLWSVSDRATAELMSRFYRGMLKEKMRPAAALRAAQIEMLQQERWRAPFYWAAFTLHGEWR
jgi:CHAT domain-containing protein/tetratricopeptide (TPR) repeat protein